MNSFRELLFNHNISKHPLQKSSLFYASLVLSFFFSFALYINTLAPTVTFEDSGELASAAYLLGVPHQPGYPLFTLLGRIFTLLPISSIIYRLNLMSAFFSSLGAMFLTWTTILLIEDVFPNKEFRSATKYPNIKFASSLAAGIFMATSFENWEQSIITEVYGLNTVFVALILMLAVMWCQEKNKLTKSKYFLLTCYFIGLTLGNHTTSLMFIPILFGFAVIVNWRFIANFKALLSGAGCLFLGLTTYIYLPVASARNPLMDWGDPENWPNFIRTVTRHQYGGTNQTLEKYYSQILTYGELLWDQWMPVFLIFAVVGWFVLYRQGRAYFYLSLLFFLCAIPVTTYLTDFDVTVPNVFAAAENKALVSVFYIPSYIFIALLMGLGIFYLVSFLTISKLKANLISMFIISLPLSFAFTNYKAVDMSQYYFAEDYVQNLFEAADSNSVVFTNWDPFYFPINYYQFVDKKRLDVITIDQQLLRRSWYIKGLEDHYPEFIKLGKAEVSAFLKAVEPFENNQKFDSNFIQSRYIAMINALIDGTIADGREVYFTYYPQSEIAFKYRKEPLVAALRLRSDQREEMTQVNISKLNFRNFFDERVPKDRMAKVFQNYYGTLMFSRAQWMEQLGKPDEAIALYLQSARFMQNQSRFLTQIRIALDRLRNVHIKK